MTICHVENGKFGFWGPSIWVGLAGWLGCRTPNDYVYLAKYLKLLQHNPYNYCSLVITVT